MPTRTIRPRGVGGLRALYVKWISRTYRFGPAAGCLLLWAALTRHSGAGPVGGLVLAAGVLALTAFVTWRHRIHAMGKATRGWYVPFWTHVAHLLRVWRLFCFWPRAVASLRMTQAQRGPTVLPPPRPLRGHEGVWWFVDGDGTFRGRLRHGPYGVTSEALSTNAAALSEYLGAYEVGVRNLRRPAAHQGKVFADLAAAWGTVSGSSEVRIFYVDSIGRMMQLRELPAAPAGKIAFGRHADRSCAYISADKSVLVMGMTGFGKSNVFWTMLADLRRSGTPVRLYVSDPKGGQELGLLGDRVGEQAADGMFEVRQYASSVKDTATMIASLRGAMVKRQTELKAAGVRKHTPTIANPLTILVIDEFLGLGKEIKGGPDGDLGLLLTQGRSSGFIVIGLAQASTKDILGDLRDLFPQRIALKLPSASSSEPAVGFRCDAHQIQEPGVGYVFKEGEAAAAKFRAPLVKDEQAAQIARGELLDMPGDEIAGEPTVLYRHYGRPTPDAEEVLLYVGITNDYAKRTAQHAADKAWWEQVTRSTTETWPSRNKALIEEEKAIKGELPLYNAVHNKANPLRRKNTKRAWDDPRRQAEVRRWAPVRKPRQKMGV